MIDTVSNLLKLAEKREDQVTRGLEKIYSAAQPGAVYSEPVTAGNYTVITASEVTAGGGFGSGLGIGPSTPSQEQQGEASQSQSANSSGGGGIGGGGGSSGRPVAVIIISPEGVTVKPMVDATKIALTAVTVVGTMFMVLNRMRRARRR